VILNVAPMDDFASFPRKDSDLAELAATARFPSRTDRSKAVFGTHADKSLNSSNDPTQQTQEVASRKTLAGGRLPMR